MKASDFIVELQRHIDEHGDIEVFRPFDGRTVDVRNVEAVDMCVDAEGHWMRCSYDLCERPHGLGVMIT